LNLQIRDNCFLPFSQNRRHKEAMSGARSQRKPTFRRQAALILFPVLVLAAVGWMSLRQDKILAEHDARERAGVIANDLIPEIQGRLATKNPNSPSFTFQVNEAGQLLLPPPRALVPAPRPLNVNELNATQAQRWLKLQRANDTAPEIDLAIQAVKDFVDSNPPENFAAAAYYNLGLLLARQKQFSEAAEAFDLVSEKYQQAVGESGLPLRPMAQFQLFEMMPVPLATNSLIRIDNSSARRSVHAINKPAFPTITLEHFVSVESLCSNIVYQPTLLTPCLLEKIQDRVSPLPDLRHGSTLSESTSQGQPPPAAPEVQETVRKWRRTWDDHELSRQLYAAVRSQVLAGAASPLLTEPNEAAEGNPLSAEAKTNQANTVASRFFWINGSELWMHRAPGTDTFVDGRNWLLVRSPENRTNAWYMGRTESEVNSEVAAVVKEKKVPNYFGVEVEIAGKRLAALAAGLEPTTLNPLDGLEIWHYEHEGGGKSAGKIVQMGTGERASTILATAASSDARPAQLKVNIYLTSPTALYQRERMRAGWFGLLILISIASAVVGLVAAWRAFTRQQQLSEMKSNFVSSVSHELRAPIASVRLMAESLDRGKIQESQKQAEYYRFIVEECRRLSSLIENVLDFSRIEQGRKQYEMEPTDLAALTRETVRLLEPYAAERQVQLKVVSGVRCQVSGSSGEASLPGTSHLTPDASPSDEKFELQVDGRAIQQALVNLIDNAIKHSPKGETVKIGLEEVSGVKCQVSGKEVDASRPEPDTPHLTPDTLNLYVEDRGPGIPLEEHEKIFERFYRRGSELRRETPGVGIGLSIVKHIVEAHGGRVVVRSAVGQGSRFTIELPTTKSENRKPKTE
jgi:signal transduction histidine kinase